MQRQLAERVFVLALWPHFHLSIQDDYKPNVDCTALLYLSQGKVQADCNIMSSVVTSKPLTYFYETWYKYHAIEDTTAM
jgi:hypothetical protein